MERNFGAEADIVTQPETTFEGYASGRASADGRPSLRRTKSGARSGLV